MDHKLLISFLRVSEPRVGVQSPRNEQWAALFEYYNTYSGEKFLHMSCGICFIKVWQFCRSELLNQALINSAAPQQFHRGGIKNKQPAVITTELSGCNGNSGTTVDNEILGG